MTAYKRPSLPPPAELAKTTARLKSTFDRLEGTTQTRRLPGPVPLSQLASHIAKANTERERRMLSEEQENVKEEILLAIDNLRGIITGAKPGKQTAARESAEMLHAAVGEYFNSLETRQGPSDSRDAIRRMREAISSMEKTRIGG